MSTARENLQRGAGAQNPIEALDASAVSAEEIVAYVCKAISTGSRLGNEASSATAGAKYRALIVAPVYKNHPGWSELESTAHDVMLVHKMLVRWGYKAENIRVLCDVCGGYYGTNYPTRENVLSSLKWLTDNTQEGDSRFLHFSGHGQRILQEKDTSQAKQARRVLTGGYSVPGDYERYVPRREPDRITTQVVYNNELAYYNEAIVTRYDPTGVTGSDITAPQIMDSELNHCLSNLPPGSSLTCIMDCCASGRILFNNTKLAGAGMRGRMSTNIMTPLAQPMKLPSVPEPSLSNETILENQPVTTPGVIESTKRTFSDMFFPAKTVLTEDIPKKERQMDHIQANTFVWTGCHQRQEAAVYEKYNSGLLTRVFTGLFDTHFDRIKARVVDYDSLFRQVSKEVNAQAFSTGSLQFVQLWSSLQDTDKGQVDLLLKSPVEL